jgi:hypothetical protein
MLQPRLAGRQRLEADAIRPRADVRVPARRSVAVQQVEFKTKFCNQEITFKVEGLKLLKPGAFKLWVK